MGGCGGGVGVDCRGRCSPWLVGVFDSGGGSSGVGWYRVGDVVGDRRSAGHCRRRRSSTARWAMPAPTRCWGWRLAGSRGCPKPGMSSVRDRCCIERMRRRWCCLYGAIPAYRALAEGATGADVAQLNHDLVALRYLDRSEVDSAWREFNWATAAGVERLQKHLGVDETGKVSLGDVVFLPTAARVTALRAGLGAPASGPVLQASSTARTVSVALDPDLQSRSGRVIGSRSRCRMAAPRRAGSPRSAKSPPSRPTTPAARTAGRRCRCRSDPPIRRPPAAWIRLWWRWRSPTGRCTTS